MPASKFTLTVTEAELKEAGLSRTSMVQAEGLTPEELDVALDRIFWGDEITQIPRPKYLMEDWVPAGAIVFLTGHGNSGKSLLGLAWSQSIARGVEWSGNHVLTPGKVLYITQEGTASFGHRLEAYMAQRGFKERSPDWGLYPHSMSLGATMQRAGHVELGQDWPKLEEMITEHRPVAVVIDPWADFFLPGMENSNDDAKAWINRARQMLTGLGALAPALIVLAHTSDANRQGGSVRGATAVYDGADRVYTITPVFPVTDTTGGFTTAGDLLAIKVSTMKSKDGGRPGPWYGKVYEHEVTDALGGTSVTVDGVSREEFYSIEHSARNGMRELGAQETVERIRTEILEALAREPRVKSQLREEIKGRAATFAEVWQELEAGGKIEMVRKDGRSEYWALAGE